MFKRAWKALFTKPGEYRRTKEHRDGSATYYFGGYLRGGINNFRFKIRGEKETNPKELVVHPAAITITANNRGSAANIAIIQKWYPDFTGFHGARHVTIKRTRNGNWREIYWHGSDAIGRHCTTVIKRDPDRNEMPAKRRAVIAHTYG